MNGKKKFLAMAVLCAVASVGFVLPAAAEETMTHDLDEVIVEADRDALPGGFIVGKDRVGVLGDLDVLDTPFTQTKYTEKTISMFSDPNQSLNGVLANNPSITIGSTGPMYTDFSMRGVNMNGNNYILNGIPNLFNQSTYMPMGILSSVEIVSGPSTVINGSTNSNDGSNGYNNAPAGLISATTKKATTNPINRYTQTFSGGSTYGESIDIGRRLGKNNEWGVRVYGLMEKGGLAIHGAEKDEKAFYINIDHQTQRSTTNLFAGYYDRNITGGQMRLGTGNLKNNLVDAPDGNSNLSFEKQIKDGRGYMATLNHEQKMNDSWQFFANLGTGKYNEHKVDPTTGNIKIEDDGSLAGTLRNYQSESTTVYAQTGLRGKIVTGAVTNNLTLAIDRSWTKSASTNASGHSIKGNIWDGVTNDAFIPVLSDYAGYSRETVVSTIVSDRLEYGKMTAFIAAQFRDGKFTNSKDVTTDKNTVNPSYALAYKPTKNLAFYASHAEGYSRPYEVTGGYHNDGTILKPVKNKQNEIGIKYKTGDMLNTLSYFDFNKGNYIFLPVSDGTSSDKKDYDYVQDGENRYKGIEWTVTGKIAPKWNVLGGAMYLDAKREKTGAVGKPSKDGWYANGAPRWNAVLAAEYEADQNNSIIGRINYTGSTHITDTGLKTPSHMTFDLGYKHKTKLNGIGVTINAMCYNLFDKNYWIGRESTITLGTPRTLMLSAQFDI